MIRFNLTSKELARVQRAAEFAGFPWRPICTRPKTARQFYKRVEAEMHCKPQALTFQVFAGLVMPKLTSQPDCLCNDVSS